jgi:hypothetical protein
MESGKMLASWALIVKPANIPVAFLRLEPIKHPPKMLILRCNTRLSAIGPLAGPLMAKLQS